MKPTPQQIESEISALETAKSYVPARTAFGDDNHRQIDLQIEELRDGVNDSGWDWDELSMEEQASVIEAREWKNGTSDSSPSSTWNDFKPNN